MGQRIAFRFDKERDLSLDMFSGLPNMSVNALA